MQTPSASPKSLRQPSQLASGAPLGRGDLPHSGEVDLVRRGLPRASGNATRAEGPRQHLARQNLKIPQANRRQRLWRRVCSEDGLPSPALHSCVRGGDTSTS